MSIGNFEDFLVGNDTLRVYCGDELVFASGKKGILPLLEYIEGLTPCEPGVSVFDMVVGNAAALLLNKINCRTVFSPLGSELAAATLRGFGIDYHFGEIVPHIKNRTSDGMCPMEELSLGKDPETFYQACRKLVLGNGFKP